MSKSSLQERSVNGAGQQRNSWRTIHTWNLTKMGITEICIFLAVSFFVLGVISACIKVLYSVNDVVCTIIALGLSLAAGALILLTPKS